jgi:hypothetical protein
MLESGAVRRAGRWLRIRRALFISALGLASSACYGFSGGGGFPPKLKTVAIIPFDNQTAVPEVQKELGDAIRKTFHDRLNLRDSPEGKADVIIRGTIAKYEVDLPAGVSGDPRNASVSRRRLQLVVDVEIVDQTTGKTLLKRPGLQSEGQYAEGQEAAGRKLAIETMVNDMIQGVQSQW